MPKVRGFKINPLSFVKLFEKGAINVMMVGYLKIFMNQKRNFTTRKVSLTSPL
jgi:hypothetical protein